MIRYTVGGYFFLLLFDREIVLAYAAERAGEIVGKVFPFGSRRDTVVGITEGFVVDVTANIANVFHNFVLLGFDFVRVVVAKKRVRIRFFVTKTILRRLFLSHFVEDRRERIEVRNVRKLDKSGVGRAGKRGVERDTREKRQRMPKRDVLYVTVAENLDFRTAIGANDVAHVFDEPEHGYGHHSRHIDGFFDDHRNELLRRSDNDNSVERDRLEHGKRNVSRPGRHIDEHKVHVAPDDVRPELFNHARDHRTAPDDGIGFVLDEQIKRHDFSAFRADGGQNSEFVTFGFCLDPEHFGNRRTCNVRVENGGFIAEPFGNDRAESGYHRLAHAAFSGHDADHFFDAAKLVRLFDHRLFFRAFRVTARAVVRALFAHKNSLSAVCGSVNIVPPRAKTVKRLSPRAGPESRACSAYPKNRVFARCGGTVAEFRRPPA